MRSGSLAASDVDGGRTRTEQNGDRESSTEEIATHLRRLSNQKGRPWLERIKVCCVAFGRRVPTLDQVTAHDVVSILSYLNR